MAPTTFHIFRHAEGEHQMRDYPPMKRDADLTENGRQQCVDWRANMPPWAGRVKRVIASPMRRALRSALISFAPILANGKMVIEVIPELTEAGSRISGFGSDPDELIACFSANGEDRMIDLSRLYAGWNPFDLNSKFAYGVDKVKARSAEVRAELRQVAAETEAEAAREGNEEGAHVIVITHSVIAHFLTNDYEGIAETGLSTWGTNLLYRSFQFGSDPHRLIETPESRARVGLPAVSTPAEQEKGRERIEARMNKRQPIIEANVREAAEAEAKAKAQA